VTAKSYPVTDGWISTRWTPAIIEDQQYQIVNYDGTSSNNYKLGIFFNGVSGISASFDYEVVEYWEAIPDSGNTPPVTTKSHSDPVGLGWVKDYLASLQETEMGARAMENFKSFLTSKALYAASSYFHKGPMSLEY
jgi:hypothetical protein